MAFPLPRRLPASVVNAILLLFEPRVRAIVDPLPKVRVEPSVSVLAMPGISVAPELILTDPLIVPDPPRAAPEPTLTELLALVEPLTSSVPAETRVAPV